MKDYFEAEVVIPTGWVCVKRGNIRVGDRILNFGHPLTWVASDRFDIGKRVGMYERVIRYKEPAVDMSWGG